MPHRIGLAIACLHVSAALYLLVGALMFSPYLLSDTGPSLPAAIALAALCLGLSAAAEVIAAGLRRRRLWAWIAGLCVFGMYLPSMFLPLGAVGLWGLLDAGSRAQFGIGGKRGGNEIAASDRRPTG
ncbi:MAG TPA: hypothetical protein VKD90_16935 [Gemmataceae bacterium]|nr:hypothetical protein [Gemmataceae bacterium]